MTSKPEHDTFRLVTSKTHELDRPSAIRHAQKHAGLKRCPTERDLTIKHVEELAQRIKGGRMLPFCWATVEYNGATYRMNGQHSSAAILEVGDALPPKIVIHMDHYEASNAADMANLFRQFDSRISSRTKQDVAGAYQGLMPELEGVSRRRGKLGVEGVAWYLRQIERMPVASGDDLYDMFLNPAYHPFLRWVDRILSVKTPEMERAAIIGAMYHTFITSETGSQEFWPHVARNDLEDDDDARSVLSRELVSIKEEKRAVAPAEFYAKCIKAWNAFRNGTRIRSLNVNPAKGLPDIAA